MSADTHYRSEESNVLQRGLRCLLNLGSVKRRGGPVRATVFSVCEVSMKQLVLVSCASKKLDHEAKAEDLYVSPLFRYNLSYARSLQPDAIYILSAKHGLLKLEDVVEPYDLTLNEMKSAEVKQWAQMVLAQLRGEADLESDHFVFLAGAKYRKHLIPHMKSFEVPLKGLGIGKQLQQLKEWLDE